MSFRYLLLIGALVLGWSGLSQPAFGEVTPCDKVASHPDDPNRTAPGYERQEIDAAAAEQICRTVHDIAPDHARTNYQLGRVIFYQGREQEALRYLRLSADAGYSQAIFVLGLIDIFGMREDFDTCRGLELLKRSASLDHPWSGYHLVSGHLSGQFEECAPQLREADLRRYIKLARDNITLSASEGRIEELYEILVQDLGLE